MGYPDTRGPGPLGDAPAALEDAGDLRDSALAVEVAEDLPSAAVLRDPDHGEAVARRGEFGARRARIATRAAREPEIVVAGEILGDGVREWERRIQRGAVHRKEPDRLPRARDAGLGDARQVLVAGEEDDVFDVPVGDVRQEPLQRPRIAVPGVRA